VPNVSDYDENLTMPDHYIKGRTRAAIAQRIHTVDISAP
jgi:hypothetical protein